MSEKARKTKMLRERLRKSKDYDSFRRAGRKLDTALGRDIWKRDDNSKLFDARRLRQRTQKYKELMEQGDVEGCLFFLRQELLRKHFGVCNPKLFEHTFTGTKEVVESYVETVCEAMTWAAFEHHERAAMLRRGGGGDVHPQVTLQEKLAFFSETKHSFGRCALLLSGGAQLGMYHFGVVKALHRNGLLPRIISGTSSGSIVCGIICVRTDAELEVMWEDGFVWTSDFNLMFFGGLDFGRFLNRSGEALYSSDVLAKNVQDNIGDMTFLEAFDRTGRICNITVSGLPGNTQYPMLLNYLTSPHVLIWSASLASTAVPGIFEPRELLMKDRHGNVVKYFPEGLKWRDGSMQNDLPMTRITELFNVNFFIVSQVNPHASILSGAGYGSSRGPIFRLAQFLRRELKQYLLSLSELGLGTAGGRVSPWLRPVGYSAVGLLVQEYEGDITIFNGRGLAEMPFLLRNGNEEMLRRYTAESERETWWHIPRIENSCKIEFVMDEILKQLRGEVLHKKADQNAPLEQTCSGVLIKRIVSKGDLGMRRLPSFQQQLFPRQVGDDSVGAASSGSTESRQQETSPLLAVYNSKSAPRLSVAASGGNLRVERTHSSLFASNASMLNLLAKETLLKFTFAASPRSCSRTTTSGMQVAQKGILIICV
eukprot:CAMPEP_0203950156 /NCGR_PEP_ID=MMETSP0359-20131031/84369_1 /ASSEMBLY_ACC=CAM_ASM_000338 /TAXON_ID=268821 /ORGANISM="Scrippsiella Hangoei, Strain SHTV-5" /LENGTH=652 /DNA_ID=CAMNT_0050882289 /DNA_START=189 /DNA_END=2148 /DNA_ORIENTATION=+